MQSVRDTFDAEPGVLEVEKHRSLEAGDVEVAKHLGEMAFVELRNDFWIDDDLILHNEIRDEDADRLLIVVDGKLFLNVTAEALFGEFDDEGALVKFFIETGFEGVEDLDRGSDDDFGEFVVVCEHGEEEVLTTDDTDGHG